jgi:3-oxoacyl-[acyl-carrier protein] reductase
VDLGIAGKTAAVAAGSAGLGLGAAVALAQEGVRVAICGRDATRLAAARARLGPDAVALTSDVSTPAGAAAFVAEARDALGPIDILVANAGGPPPGTFATTDLDAYARAFDLNCRSTIAMCQEAIPAMRERGWGRVVAITSIGVKAPIGTLMASSVARAAVTSFLKITAREVAPDGVTVNNLCPGLHSTDRMTQLYGDTGLDDLAKASPTGRLGDPSDFGAFVAFLCSEQAKFVNGTSVQVDGGAFQGLL